MAVVLTVWNGRPAVEIEAADGEVYTYLTEVVPSGLKLAKIDPETQKPGAVYTVTHHPDKWWCDCPHFWFRCRQDGAECKHIRDGKQVLALFGAIETQGQTA